jgi:hypothetical protein
MTVTAIRPVRVASVQGALALDLTAHQDPPDGPVAPVVDLGRAARGEFERFAGRIMQAVVEIVGGDRPVTQLLRWTAPEVYQDLGRRALLVSQAVGRRPGQGGVQGTRPQVIGVHTCFVADGIAEVSAHVRYGRRSRAVAARFEQRRDRWVCSALEFA